MRVGAEEHILDAARRGGLDLPSACEMGWDLACACRVLEGEWDNSDARRYYGEDAEAGFVLICTAKPRSDLVIRPGFPVTVRPPPSSGTVSGAVSAASR